MKCDIPCWFVLFFGFFLCFLKFILRSIVIYVKIIWYRIFNLLTFFNCYNCCLCIALIFVRLSHEIRSNSSNEGFKKHLNERKSVGQDDVHCTTISVHVTVKWSVSFHKPVEVLMKICICMMKSCCLTLLNEVFYLYYILYNYTCK